MKLHLSLLSIAASAMLFASDNASAVAIDCPSDADLADMVLELNRQASLDPAVSCEYGSGNPDGSDFFGGDWSEQGETEGDDGETGTLADGFLSVEVIEGSWGSRHIVAAITIGSGFWDMFGRGVLSAHVGNGNGEPDWFAWTLPFDTTSATFRYDISGNANNRGGGLSNIKLWGKDTPDITVPEPSTVGLLGISLLVASVMGRRRRSQQ